MSGSSIETRLSTFIALHIPAIWQSAKLWIAAPGSTRNRLDAGDRDNCYAAIVSRVAVGTGPEANVYYEQNPSHLPANDVRRQEANNAYGAARAALMVVPAVAHQT